MPGQLRARTASGQAMLNRVSYGEDILANAKSSAVKALYIKWKTLSQLKTVTLTDFFETNSKYQDKFIVLLCTQNDYFYAYFGATHRDTMGHDLSGKLLSQIDSRIGLEIRQIYDQVCETGMPVRLILATEAVTYATGWERLILPITVAGEVRMLLIFSDALNSAIDIHNYLFQSSPHMLIEALPIWNYDGEVVDADILKLNPPASSFFEAERFREHPIRLRQFSPWFDDDHTWRMLTEQTETEGCERVLHEGRSGKAFKFIIVKLDYLMLFRIYPLPASEVVTLD
jgi:hypothetical protein